tara:strand:- start:46 stop:423 length:378 start_codon:yes stop_codon:yes gene_type:complete
MTKEEVVTKEEKKLEPKPEPKFEPWTKEERESSKDKYCCEILVSNGTLADVNSTQVPTDAFVVKYIVDDKTILDLTRGTKTKIFDMYWDKFKGGLKDIQYGKGTISPKMWGYQSPNAPKRKKKGR